MYLRNTRKHVCHHTYVNQMQISLRLLEENSCLSGNRQEQDTVCEDPDQVLAYHEINYSEDTYTKDRMRDDCTCD